MAKKQRWEDWTKAENRGAGNGRRDKETSILVFCPEPVSDELTKHSPSAFTTLRPNSLGSSARSQAHPLCCPAEWCACTPTWHLVAVTLGCFRIWHQGCKGQILYCDHKPWEMANVFRKHKELTSHNRDVFTYQVEFCVVAPANELPLPLFAAIGSISMLLYNGDIQRYNRLCTRLHNLEAAFLKKRSEGRLPLLIDISMHLLFPPKPPASRTWSPHLIRCVQVIKENPTYSSWHTPISDGEVFVTQVFELVVVGPVGCKPQSLRVITSRFHVLLVMLVTGLLQQLMEGPYVLFI